MRPAAARAAAPDGTTDQDGLAAALARGAAALGAAQQPDGAWRGEYGGPGFLLPMYVGACHLAGRAIPPARAAGMIAELRAALQPDGSLGLHAERGGSMFTSALGYVALRLLGVAPDDPGAAALRGWIRAHGSPLGAASWGKLVLALLNLYDYAGLHPVLPELWLLPAAAPLHPARLWCHCRQVYLPMAWLYGTRSRGPVTPLIAALRAELYAAPYAAIDFRAHRDTLAPGDALVPTTRLLALANRALAAYEARAPRALRRRALAAVMAHLEHEDGATAMIRIGPVNAVLNTLVHHFRDPGGPAVAASFRSLDGYLWEEGGRVAMNGYNSTALWDTAFAAQALLAADAGPAARPALAHAHGFIEANQVLTDVPDGVRHHRHPSAGGWPFSDRPHGWPISDCTAEGLRAALALEAALGADVAAPLSVARLAQAVACILSLECPGGGWATYEPTRGPRWLELLNPSQVFADIMIDYPYVECTAACVQALVDAGRRLPGRFGPALDGAVARGVRFLRRTQRGDGSWEGSWAVCFTYGTWFGVSGLAAAGAPPGDDAIRRAVAFLGAHQAEDGGFGEHFTSCTERRWVAAPSHPVQTAWALLALVRGGAAASAAAARAADYLLGCQQLDGAWPRGPRVGVFNKTALINYDNYRRYFPLWALGEYARATRAIPA